MSGIGSNCYNNSLNKQKYILLNFTTVRVIETKVKNKCWNLWQAMEDVIFLPGDIPDEGDIPGGYWELQSFHTTINDIISINENNRIHLM